METLPTSDPQREQRPAGQLTADHDWIIAPGGGGVALVLGVFKWPYSRRVAVAYQGADGGIGMFSVPVDQRLSLATDAEADAVRQGWQREAYAGAFEQFAQLIRCQDFPLPEEGEPFRGTVRYPDRGPVEALASVLGLPVDEVPSQVTARWPADDPDGVRPPLQVLLFAPEQSPARRRPAARDWVRADQEPGRDSDEPGLETTQVIVPARADVGVPLGAGGYRLGRVAAAP